MSSPPALPRSNLLNLAKSFCNAFSSQQDPSKIYAHFTNSHASKILIREHGLQQLAPFLGRDFTGLEGVKQYFEIITSSLSYEDMKFSDYIVDEVEGKVSVRGEAKFTWRDTGQSWDEVFRYVLGFVTDKDEGGDGDVEGQKGGSNEADGKLVRYEIWADSGAAYLARKGLLDAGTESTASGERESSGQMLEAGKRTEGGELERYVMSCENFMRLNGLK